VFSGIAYSAYMQQQQMAQYGLGTISWPVIATYGVSLVLDTALILLPIGLLTIQHVYLKAVEALVDTAAEERPRRLKRFLYGCCIALGSTILLTALYILLTGASTRFSQLQWVLIAYFGIATLIATLIASIIITASVNHTVARDDRDLDIAPMRSAGWMMLIYTVLLILWMFIVPTAHIWFQVLRSR